MKRLADLSAYAGVLPYASEIFGVYQPMLGWKSKRRQEAIDTGRRAWNLALLERLKDTIAPQIDVETEEYQIRSVQASPGTVVGNRMRGIVTGAVARALPPREKYDPAIWKTIFESGLIQRTLKEDVPKLVLERGTSQQTRGRKAILRKSIVDAITSAAEEESRSAGLLSLLYEHKQIGVLESIFYGKHSAFHAIVNAMKIANDPFATIDPAHDLNRVGISPVGIVHLFRQYFFELDTFLGTPVGHVWVSPGATVELVEVHTRRVLVEQSVEQLLESVHKSEKSTTQQDDLSGAVKEDNKTDTKLGVNVSASQSIGVVSANESASFDMGTSQSRAREQTHKSMRQQSEKLSTEIKQSYKTTFRMVNETTDMSSKRYVLENKTDKLVNYELRRKMRQVAVQVQDIGSYLCWQTYVDNPGRNLGISRLVHIGSPPNLSSVPPPDKILPPESFIEDVVLTIPFEVTGDGDASNDDGFAKGNEVTLGELDQVNQIIATHPQGPFFCKQSGFQLAAVTIDPAGADAKIEVRNLKQTPDKKDPTIAGGWTFDCFLLYANFGGSNSMTVKARLAWHPSKTKTDEIEAKNKENLDKFTAREQASFRQAFLEQSRERIKLASDIQPRRSEDLREEERIVVYRDLIEDLLEPTKIARPDQQTQHVVAELINSIFDVDKLLYFVAPEWWRPRRADEHHQQQLGALDAMGTSGQQTSTPSELASQNTYAWGDRDTRKDSYYITEDSKPAPLGSSLGWLLQLDGDNFRNAFLNAPWVKAVMPIRPGKEKAALNWLRHIEGTNGIEPNDVYGGPEPEWHGNKTVFEVLNILADEVAKKHKEGTKSQSFKDPMDDNNKIQAIPLDRVYEHGFDPLHGGFKSNIGEDFEIFDQWVEVLPTDQVAAVEVTYDPKTGRQI